MGVAPVAHLLKDRQAATGSVAEVDLGDLGAALFADPRVGCTNSVAAAETCRFAGRTELSSGCGSLRSDSDGTAVMLSRWSTSQFFGVIRVGLNSVPAANRDDPTV